MGGKRMKELIKENSTYKLFLLNMLEAFEINSKVIRDKEMKRYFIKLSRAIKDILNIDDREVGAK